MFANGEPPQVHTLGGEAALFPLADALKDARFKNLFARRRPERVIRQGILSCSVYDPKCMFMMMLPGDATAASQMELPVHGTKVIPG